MKRTLTLILTLALGLSGAASTGCKSSEDVFSSASSISFSVGESSSVSEESSFSQESSLEESVSSPEEESVEEESTSFETESSESHEHEFGEWQSDEDRHWKECDCGERQEEGPHNLDGNNDCTVCKAHCATSGLTFARTEGGYAVTGVKGTCQSLIIPSVYEGEAVLEIAEAAFGNGKFLEVRIPDSVKSIGANAFAVNTVLVNVRMGERIESIAEGVFGGCGSLEELIIPAAVKSIGANAFLYCKKLARVEFKNPDGWQAGEEVIPAEDFKDFAKIAQYLTKNEVFEGFSGVLFTRAWTREEGR